MQRRLRSSGRRDRLCCTSQTLAESKDLASNARELLSSDEPFFQEHYHGDGYENEIDVLDA